MVDDDVKLRKLSSCADADAVAVADSAKWLRRDMALKLLLSLLPFFLLLLGVVAPRLPELISNSLDRSGMGDLVVVWCESALSLTMEIMPFVFFCCDDDETKALMVALRCSGMDNCGLLLLSLE